MSASRSSRMRDAFLSQFEEKLLATYRKALVQWFEWCSSNDVDPLEAAPQHFERFKAEIAPTKARSSFHSQQGVIARFYRYVASQDDHFHVPVPDGWRRPLPYLAVPENSVSAATLVALDAAALRLGGMHLAVVRLISELGPLPAAIARIKPADLRIEDSSTVLKVPARQGGGALERQLSSELGCVMRELLGARPDGPLFLSREGTPLDQKGLIRLLDRVAAEAGVASITPMSLRQSTAVALSRSGLPSSHVDALLGVRSRRFKDFHALPADPAPWAFAAQLMQLARLLLDEPGAEAAASVVLTGSGLEYYLKRLAAAAGLTPPLTGGIAAVASALRSADVISKQERKEIEAWAGLRNSAVHGDFGDIGRLQARHLNEGVAAFVDKHPL